MQSKCSAKESSLPSAGWGEGSWERMLASACFQPILFPPSFPRTQAQLWRGASICMCCQGGMGCPASRAEDDSLGCGPGTLGKARPASGQSLGEPGGREEGAKACLSHRHHPGDSQNSAASRAHLSHFPQCQKFYSDQ